MVFDRQTGTTSGDPIADVIFGGTAGQGPVIIKGFNDCEHAYFTVMKPEDADPSFYSWWWNRQQVFFVCNASGSGSPNIDEMTVTCTDYANIASVQYVKLTPI